MTPHLSGLLTIVAVQLGAIFADQATPLPAKLAASAATLLLLIFSDPKKQVKVVTVVLGAVGIAVPVVGFALTKMPAQAFAAHALTVALAVFVRLPALLPVPAPIPVTAHQLDNTEITKPETPSSKGTP